MQSVAGCFWFHVLVMFYQFFLDGNYNLHYIILNMSLIPLENRCILGYCVRTSEEGGGRDTPGKLTELEMQL